MIVTNINSREVPLYATLNPYFAKAFEDMKKIEGDIMILGAGGKMGPTLCVLAKNAIKEAGVDKKVYAVSRGSDKIATDLMKENGIGRPSTRAEIIKTLFKRNYIRNEKKNIIATETGIELVGLIRNELLKSAELTGQWERKLRDIERRKYEAKQFVDELKSMLVEVVNSVLRDNSTISR